MALAALIVAIVAASVSGLTFLWTIFWSIYEHRQRTRPTLRVIVKLAYVHPYGQPFVDITVTNTGQPAAELRGIDIYFKHRPEHVALVGWWRQNALPCHLETGNSWNGLIESQPVKAPIRPMAPQGGEIRFVARDAADNQYSSEWIDWKTMLGD
jgi:hypothetical protein